MALVDTLLQRDHDTDLREYLTNRRGDGLSFDGIARDLEALLAVDGYSITYATIRRWCIRLGIDAEAAS